MAPTDPGQPDPPPPPPTEPDPPPAMPTLQQVQLYLAGLRAQLPIDDARRYVLEEAMSIVASVPLTAPTSH